LSAAYYLGKRGVSSMLIEKRPRLGGVIQTERIDACLVEGGPDSFLSSKPWAMALIRELGLEHEVIGSNDHLRKTFIRKQGRMIPLPAVEVASVITTPLLSWTTKAKIAREYFRRPATTPRPDCSVAEFITDHYGQEVVDYVAEPLLAGVYGGTPETLSVASVAPKFVELESKYGSLSKGILAERKPSTEPTFRTLKNGLGSLVEALQTKANVVHGEVETIERTPGGYRLRVSGDWLDAERVALACESHASAALLRAVDPVLAQELSKIPYTSSTVIAMAFEPQSLEGFGFLVPRKERRRIVACTFMGTKFPFRVPENRFLVRCFVSDTGDDSGVLEELRDLTGLRGDPVFIRSYPWPQSMAQYLVGHGATISRIQDRLSNISGLYLTGNAYYGVGIPDCIRGARQLAEKVTPSGNGPSNAKY